MLDERGEPRPASDVREWGRWIEGADERRLIARTVAGSHLVSTVFLGLDHDYTGMGPPILWETAIISGPHKGYLQRYSTRYAAIRGHQYVVNRLTAGDFRPYTDEGVEVIRLAKKLAAERWGSSD